MKKTIIGIMIMAVAVMMTLSTAVFAANTITVSGAETKVDGTVTVTVNHPAGTTAGEYTVTYDPAVLEYTGDDTVTGNTIKVAFMDTDYKEVPSHTLTFKAIAEGTSAITVANATLAAGTTEMADVAVSNSEVKVAAKTADNTNTNTDNGNTNTDKKDGDKTIDKLKDAKTGFDAMYLVYLAAAVVVAAGIVTVAKRK